MKFVLVSVLFILAVTRAEAQSPNEYLRAKCGVLLVYLNNSPVLRTDVQLYYSGLLDGVSMGHVSRYKILEAFTEYCAANPSASVTAALTRAFDALGQE